MFKRNWFGRQRKITRFRAAKPQHRRTRFELLEHRRVLATIVLGQDTSVGDVIGSISPTGSGTTADPFVYDFDGDDLDMAGFDILGAGKSFRFEDLGMDAGGRSIQHSGDGGVLDVSNSSGDGGWITIEAGAGAVELASIDSSGDDGGMVLISSGSLLIEGEDGGGMSVNTSSPFAFAGKITFEVNGPVTLFGGIDASGGLGHISITDKSGQPSDSISIGGDINTSTASADGGRVLLNGQTVEVQGSILTHSGEDTGGRVTILGPQGVNVQGGIVTHSDAGSGAVALSATNDVFLGNLDINNVDTIDFAAGGNSFISRELLNFDVVGSPQLRLDSAGTVFYDPAAPANFYLDGDSYPLESGGVLRPINLPPEADTGGPYAILEGDALSLDASGSSDPDGDPLTYRWDVDGDGDFDENVTGEAPNLSWGQLVALGIDDGPDVRTVTVEVSDAFDTDTSSTALNIENVVPTVQLDPVSPIFENDSLSLVGQFDDPGVGDSHDVVVGWGDPNNAAASTFALPATRSLTAGNTFNSSTDNAVLSILAVDPLDGEVEFTLSHRYLDDGEAPGNGTATDSGVINVTVTDDVAGGSAEIAHLIQNVAPEISSLASDATFTDRGEESAPVTVSATFSDVGTLDRHTATVDWGNGTVTPGAVVEAGGSGTITASYAYTTGGIYTVTVTLNDDDTGAHTATTTAVVAGVGVNDGVLFIVGTAAADRVTVNQQGNGLLKVHADFLTEGNFRTFDAADVDQIIAYMFEGDDHMTIAGNVDLPAIVHGGDDNDHLNAGGGPAVLLGDAGNDMLTGGSVRNILIGGIGIDRLIGGNQGDVLIGGSTNIDESDAALLEVLDEWNSADPYAARVAVVDSLLDVLDDSDSDRMTGSSGRDLFYDGLGEDLTDVNSKHQLETVL